MSDTDEKQQKPDNGQIEPGDLSGEQKDRGERRREKNELKKEAERLQVFQRNTLPQVEQIMTEALSCILPMGWTVGAVINDDGAPEFKILPLSIAQYQEVKKERFRSQFTNPLGK